MQRRAGVMVTMGAALAVGLTMSAPAHAVYPVIDSAAIRQLVVQINYWRQQIAGMKNELAQLQQTHAALTGSRGMQALLPTHEAQRNYLPRDWAGVAQVLSGQSAQYGALAQATAAYVNDNALLDPVRLARMSAQERASVEEGRRAAAGYAVMTQAAYAQAGARFASLAELVRAIGTAGDAKAIADLQGRIAAEQAMLENEQAKLEVLAQAAEAGRRVQEQRLRELAIAGHGTFATRLRPTLPN